jgi:hypothetical protein
MRNPEDIPSDLSKETKAKPNGEVISVKFNV